MTHQTDTARERSREATGRFGTQERTAPEVELAAGAPHGTYDVPVDELNGGDTILVDGKAHLVYESFVLGIEPETRVAVTETGDIRLDREERVTIVRTGDEPKPEDADGFAGHCHRCGEAFAEDHNHVTSHIHPRGGTDYDADRDHIPFSYDADAHLTPEPTDDFDLNW